VWIPAVALSCDWANPGKTPAVSEIKHDTPTTDLKPLNRRNTTECIRKPILRDKIALNPSDCEAPRKSLDMQAEKCKTLIVPKCWIQIASGNRGRPEETKQKYKQYDQCEYDIHAVTLRGESKDRKYYARDWGSDQHQQSDLNNAPSMQLECVSKNCGNAPQACGLSVKHVVVGIRLAMIG
jgi:hypothetical protein